MKHHFCLLFVCLFYYGISFSQKSKDGAETYSAAGTVILNRYATLAASATAGDNSITVTNIADLSGATSFTNSVNPYAANALAVGDLVLIIQVQGADIATTNDAAYGNITAYNNTGNHEIKSVNSVTANTIGFCIPLANSYTQGGRARTQVVRIPRLSSLTVGAGVTLSGQPWAGTSGGIVALEVNGNITINGTISATGIGLRGGTDPFPGVSSGIGGWQMTYYVDFSPVGTSAEKGESIAGNTNDYETLLNGSIGRGAPANGGGGGNGHNCGGGGGANAGSNGSLTPWNGTGIKNTSTASWANAWNLESAGFASDVSMGGGRGGHSYCTMNQDALTVAPSDPSWSGDFWDPFGGFGGRPLDYSGNTLLFMGGGGGAGDGNNNDPGAGGNGGGIIYILCNGDVNGAGSIVSNGNNGGSNTNGEDAGGGGGGGGAINILASGLITGINISANGGNGGNHGLHGSNQIDGAGAGGGGGYIATTATAVTRTVNGGDNGISLSPYMSEFPPSGATQGNSGTTVTKVFADVTDCVTLPSRFIDVKAVVKDNNVTLQWKVTGEINVSHYIVEKSTDNRSFSRIAAVDYRSNSNIINDYSHIDHDAFSTAKVLYYRVQQVDVDGKTFFSKTIIIPYTGKWDNSIKIIPNPVISQSTAVIYSDKSATVKMQVYDAGGKKLSTSKIKLSPGENHIPLETEKLAPGIYIMKVETPQRVITSRLIKN